MISIITKDIFSTIAVAMRLMISGLFVILFWQLSKSKDIESMYFANFETLHFILIAAIGVAVHASYRAFLSCFELILFTTPLTSVCLYKKSKWSIIQGWSRFIFMHHSFFKHSHKTVSSFLEYRWSLCHLSMQISCCFLFFYFIRDKESFYSDHKIPCLVLGLLTFIASLIQLLILYHTEKHLHKNY